MSSNVLEKMRQNTKRFLEQETKFRLPNGARFEAVYDAAREKWKLILTIGENNYAVVGSGIHWCLRKAGQQWSKNKPN